MPIQTRAWCRLLAVAALTAMALLAIVGTAGARTVPVYTYTGKYYDGTGSTAGTLAFGTDVAVNQATNHVYVTDPSRLEGSVSQFDSEGNPLPFSALEGATAVSPHREGADRVAVDNSSTGSAGNIYVLAGNIITGYEPDGRAIGGAFPIGGFGAACSLAVDAEGNIWGVDYRRSVMVEFSSSGVPTGRKVPFTPIAIGQENGTCDLAIDSNDNFYLDISGPEKSFGKKYDSEGNFLYDFIGGSTFGYAQSVDVDLATNDVFVLQNAFGSEYDTEVVEYDESGEAITSFGAPDPAHSFLGLTQPPGFAVSHNAAHVYVANGRDYGGLRHVEIFAPTAQAVVPTTKTEPPALAPTSVTLKGTVDLDGGGDATSCYFEWGSNYLYGQIAECTPPGTITGSGVHTVTAALEGLTHGAQYHYRLVVKNANGILAFGRDRAFRPQGPLTMSPTVVSDVNTDGAVIASKIDPNGGDVRYFVEYGLEDCDLSECARAPAQTGALPKALGVQTASVRLSGLSPDTGYHYRLVAASEFGEVVGNEDTFRTYAVDSTDDTCPNALVRKETAALLLPDCRAYEIVSAQDAGGYDVRSDLVPGQVPLPAKPRANDSMLYSLNFGRVPGVAGEPTNNGLDPYVATRTDSGWTTRYAGIGVGDPPYQAPFASTPLEESEDLSTLAFGGPEICSPCFEDGKTGIPVRRNGGALTQGMAGSLDPGPAAAPDGYIGRRLSADGTHLIFGSTSAFEPGAATGGDVSIYDRNLVTGVTHVVSKTPGGANLPCVQGAGSCHGPGNADGIGSLDVSGDGSRIVVAQRISTDSAGNDYWHPYMNIGDSGSTVDLAPGTTSGVLFDGMTSDGSSVLYTTVDRLTPDDHDSSADIYRADVSPSGDLTLTRVSQGAGAGDTDACDPAAAAGRNNWNTIGASSANGCGALAFAGGAGVAGASGTIYFLSPEKLDGGSGTTNQPNLYVAARGGTPHFVAPLEPGNPAIGHAVEDSAARSFGDIQVTPSGAFAAFSSGNPLTGFPTFGHVAIYRYAADGDTLICASCPTTRASLVADTELSPYGLNLTDDGRVFFTSVETLALRDTGTTTDVYERSGEALSLISTGRSSTDTGLLSASADGVNAFFYTRESMVSSDRNGKTMKIYTAREDGGFLSPVIPQECQASDECHGAGSAAPSSSALPTFQGTGGNYDKPVQKQKKKKHRSKKHRRKHGHHHRNGGTARSADRGRNG
jgi:hypothetical protein